MEYLWNIYVTSMKYHGPSMEYCGIRVEDIWNSYGHLRNIYGMPRNLVEHAWNIYGTSMEHLWNMMEYNGISSQIYAISLNINGGS